MAKTLNPILRSPLLPNPHERYQSAEQYIQAHALDGRSIEREHLDALLNKFSIPSDALARMLRIPRWFLHRKAHRWGLYRKKHTEKTDSLMLSAPAQPRNARKSSNPPQVALGTTSDRKDEAMRYIATRGLSGTSTTKNDLGSLLNILNIPISSLAMMLDCHEELLVRKARRWGLRYKDAEDIHQFKRKARSAKYRREIRDVHRELYAEARAYVGRLGAERRARPTPDDLRYLYQELRLPLRQIGRLFDRSDNTIILWMKAAGLARRRAAETKLAHYNATFFKTWSPAMAWVLGLIYTDGNLSRDSVALASVDTELLEKVQRLVSPKHRISMLRQSYDHTKTIGRFQIHHAEMVSDLRQLGLKERKSLDMDFPAVPEDCISHFIRGCWDGDGGFADNMAHYTCGSRRFIERIARELFKVDVNREILRRNATESFEQFQELRSAYGAGPYPPTIYKRKNANAFDLRIGSPRALQRLYNYLYKDVDPQLYLTRKHDKLRSIVRNTLPGADAFPQEREE